MRKVDASLTLVLLASMACSSPAAGPGPDIEGGDDASARQDVSAPDATACGAVEACLDGTPAADGGSPADATAAADQTLGDATEAGTTDAPEISVDATVLDSQSLDGPTEGGATTGDAPEASNDGPAAPEAAAGDGGSNGVDASGDSASEATGDGSPDGVGAAGDSASDSPDESSAAAGSFCNPTCGSDHVNCGSGCQPGSDCNTSCAICTLPHASAMCAGTACAIASCEPGWADCNQVALDGCESDLSSAATCGFCNQACTGAAPLCSGGTCVASCTPPLSTCTGRCTNLVSDAYNCGGCGTSCTSSGRFPECAGGSCVPDTSCPRGYTACPSGSCAYLDGDPNNCGSCGHSCSAATSGFAVCSGGACIMTCQPGWTLSGTTCVAPSLGPTTVLTTAGQGIHAIALDADHVYWTDSTAGTVSAVPKTGGMVVTLAQGQAKPLDVAVDDTYAYWSDNLGGAIMRAPKDGSGTPAAFVAITSPTDITVAGNDLFWLTTTNSISSTPLADGGSGSPINSWSSEGGGFYAPEAQSLTSNGRYLFVRTYYQANYYFDVVDPVSFATLQQVNVRSGTYVVGAIDSTDYYDEVGDHCPGIDWASLPDAGGASGSVSTAPFPNNCSSQGASVVAGNACGVFWSGAAGGAYSKAGGFTVAIPASGAPLAADDLAVYIVTASTITRVQVQ